MPQRQLDAQARPSFPSASTAQGFFQAFHCLAGLRVRNFEGLEGIGLAHLPCWTTPPSNAKECGCLEANGLRVAIVPTPHQQKSRGVRVD